MQQAVYVRGCISALSVVQCAYIIHVAYCVSSGLQTKPSVGPIGLRNKDDDNAKAAKDM